MPATIHLEGQLIHNVTLQRFAYGPWGTFGVLRTEGLRWYSLERPWLDNRRRESCVPCGEYPMSYHTWFSKPMAEWRIDSVPGRDAILIHVGNTMDDLAGCVALGLDLGWVHDRWAVVKSRDAMRQFNAAMEPLRDHGATCLIENNTDGWRET